MRVVVSVKQGNDRCSLGHGGNFSADGGANLEHNVSASQCFGGCWFNAGPGFLVGDIGNGGKCSGSRLDNDLVAGSD